MKLQFAAATALGLALLATPVLAGNLTGDGFFTYGNARGGLDQYYFGGAANYTFDSGMWNLGGAAEDTHFNVGTVDADAPAFRGDLFWRGMQTSIGASFAYHPVSGSASFGAVSGSGNADIFSYGAFGEWYAADNFTVHLKGGAYGGDGTGAFFGTGATFYIMPDLSANADYDWQKASGPFGGDLSIIRAGLEYMPFSGAPLSLGGYYSYQEGGGASSNGFGISLKYRFGSAGSGSLTDWDRMGPTKTNGALNLSF